MRWFTLPLCAAIVATGFASVSRGASEDEIEAARKAGMQYLLDAQTNDGSWDYPGHGVGITSLCAVALIENGVPIDDRAIERAHRYVLDNYLDVTQTYDISLAILFLSRLGDRDDKTAIRDLAARLIAGQNQDGGWHYTCPKVRSAYLTGGGDRPDPPGGPGDNSCTQFATLGLWVASRWDVNIDEPMAHVAYRFVRDQNKDGGWPYMYSVATPQGSSQSMSFAGLFCLTVARANRIRAIQRAQEDGKDPPKLPEIKPRTPAPPAANTTPGTPMPEEEERDEDEPTLEEEEAANFVDPGKDTATLQDDPVFSRGLEFATQLTAGIGAGSPRYFLWSVERMGVILGMEKFGEVDWFQRGADALLAVQGQGAGEFEGEEGAWTPPGTGNALSDTSFAILFLRKANLGSDITQLLAGEPTEPFQIISQPEQPRFFQLAEAIKSAQPGDVIRIDSNRTIELPHLEVTQDLTIEAGLGYNPILKYEQGFDERGIRADPARDAKTRYLFGVESGTLTLEGLRLHMDPPKVSGKVEWSGISVTGGRLRMLNCLLVETARQGFAAVAVSGPGEVEIRNSLLIGGRAAVEVKTSGAQTVTVQNSVLFSNLGISVLPGTDAGESLTFNLERTSIQAPEIFSLAKVTSPVAFNVNGVAFFGDALGSKFLRSRTGSEGITWTGSENVYDVKKWVGFDGAFNSAIRDAKTWTKFWGETEMDSDNKVIVFSGKRRHGAFTADVPAQDFEFASTSQVYASRRRTGINPIYVGPGYNYLLFREGFDYNSWQEAAQVASN
jgi:hypothetical protein